MVNILWVEEQPVLLLRLRTEEGRRGGPPPRVFHPFRHHPDVLPRAGPLTL